MTKVVVRNQNGANVTNAWEPDGESLTVTAEYNFAEADRLDLTVEDSDGVDVTREVASGDRITTSGGSVQLDLSDQQEGTFRITLEGSDLDRASRTVTVRTGPRRTATPLPSPTTPAGTPTPSPTPTDVGTESPTETPTPTEQPTETGASPGTPTEAAGTEQPTETPTPTATETSGPGFGPLAAVLAVVALAGYALRRRSR
ncbi:hypothetical protein BRC83_00005 [Halobacteriales archaeon QS_1_68_17]|nr:MAG: hypothetical protein BRC83_00005 [Halobacteriales archaeon QS_1_68_17]